MILSLFVAALNSKEIAVSLPLAIAFYELLWHPPAGWNLRDLFRWTWHEGRFAAIAACFDAAYILGKRFGPDSLWRVDAYQPHVSFAAYFHALAAYLAEQSYKERIISNPQIAALLFIMLILALIARSRPMLWAWAFILVGVLPLAFIPIRGGFAYIVPLIGWGVYGAALVQVLIEKLPSRPVWLRTVLPALLLIILGVKMGRWQRKWIEMHARASHEITSRFQGYIGEIRALLPSPRKGAHILLLTDADGHADWDVNFLMRLSYGDKAMEVDRMAHWREHHITVDPNGYDYVLDWVDHHFVLVSKPVLQH